MFDGSVMQVMWKWNMKLSKVNPVMNETYFGAKNRICLNDFVFYTLGVKCKNSTINRKP